MGIWDNPAAEARGDPTTQMSSEELWSKLSFGVDPHFSIVTPNTIYTSSPTQSAGLLGSFSEAREAALQVKTDFTNMIGVWDDALRGTTWSKDPFQPPPDPGGGGGGYIAQNTFSISGLIAPLMKALLPYLLILMLSKRKKGDDE